MDQNDIKMIPKGNQRDPKGRQKGAKGSRAEGPLHVLLKWRNISADPKGSGVLEHLSLKGGVYLPQFRAVPALARSIGSAPSKGPGHMLPRATTIDDKKGQEVGPFRPHFYNAWMASTRKRAEGSLHGKGHLPGVQTALCTSAILWGANL